MVLARRYANALFSVGKEDGALLEYAEKLNEFAEIFNQMPEVSDALANPLYPEELRFKVMERLLALLGVRPVLANFCKLLLLKKRVLLLPEIAEAMQALVDEDNNLLRGTLVSAAELDSGLKDKVKATMEKITGKKVELTNRIDPAIIGGMVAKVGDLVLDGSIRSQLAGLKESIRGRE